MLLSFLNRHNDRSKQQEREVLEQGLSTIEATVTTSEPLPAVVPLQPTLLPVPTIRSPHQFVLPQNTIGQARTRPQPHIQPPQIPQFQFIVPPSPNINSPPTNNSQEHEELSKKEERRSSGW